MLVGLVSRMKERTEMAAEFTNVSVVKAANVFFDGQVTSRTVKFADGSRKTLGVMLPGEYQFNVGDRELMEILAGDCEVQIGDQGDWQTIKAGESFEVPANSSFKIKSIGVTDYCCSFFS
jgi:purine/pyrimidine-nucleoside phosphorylase